MRTNRVLGSLVAALLTAACQTTQADAPAVLSRADEETMSQVHAALVHAMGRATVEIGASDLQTSSTVAVLPRTPIAEDGRNLAVPTLFDLVLRGDECFLVRRDTGEAFALRGVACRPA